MKLRRIETPGISHFAYLISDGAVAAVVDPCRDAERYCDAAREMGCRITHVLETHRHEDFVMGSSYLSELTGAKVVNTGHKLFGRCDIALDDGEVLEVGGLKLEALHTPGHTPESVCYVIHDGDAGQPWGVFTGDTLFFGETGRSDLPDEDKSVENAGLIWDAVHDKLAPLGDQALIFPAHGPGSVCGSGMADRSSSTIGAEKNYNPVFQLARDAFARKKGGEQLPRPPYFRHMEKVNLKGGIAPSRCLAGVPLLDVAAFAEAADEALVIDTREPEAFAGAHIPDCHSVWMGGLPVFGGWVADHDSRVLLLTDREGDVDTALLHLSRIGIDKVFGALQGGFGNWRGSGRDMKTCGTIVPEALAGELDRYQVLDVREEGEFSQGHIPGAYRVYVGDVVRDPSVVDLERDMPTVVTCGVGHRASVAVSALLRHGFTEVYNLIGGMSAWQSGGHPTN